MSDEDIKAPLAAEPVLFTIIAVNDRSVLTNP